MECFLSMIITPKFRNVASRMLTGRAAYDSEVICIERADSEECIDDLQSTINAVCELNFILMWQVLPTVLPIS